MEKFYKSGKAAQFIGVSFKTLKRLVKKGIIVPAKTTEGGRYLYSETQLLEFKNGIADVPDVITKKEGDTYKFENRDKNRDNPQKNALEQGFLNDESEEKRYNLEVIPPETLKICDKNRKDDVISPISELENRDTSVTNISVSIVPTTKLTVPNDKFCKTFFNLSQEDYAYILKHGGAIKECRLPKIGDILSDYEVTLIRCEDCPQPLNMFDKAVLIACDSEKMFSQKIKCNKINVFPNYIMALS